MYDPSTRFISFFKAIVILILGGSILFSIVRNIRGLEAGYPGVDFEWQLLIALTVTLASFALTGSSALAVFPGNRHLRLSLFTAGVMFSAVSFFLSFEGAKYDQTQKYQINAAKSPEVEKLEVEIEDVVERQNAYGASSTVVRSLLMREKELRSELKEVRARARAQAESDRRRDEKDADKIDYMALAMFCALPEVGLITFTLLLILLNGVSVFSQMSMIDPNIPLPPYQLPVQPQPGMPSSVSIPQQPTINHQQKNSGFTVPVANPQVVTTSQNGAVPEGEKIEAVPQPDKWNPFG